MSSSESHGRLPDEEDQEISYGESFVQATYSPPNLSEKLYKDELVWYHTVNEPYTSILDYFKYRKYYFVHFYDARKKYKGPDQPVSISREDISRAWIVGINGYRFHDGLLKWVESTEGEQPDLVAPWQTEWRKLKGELKDVAVQWKLLFKEVDVAMSLLEKHENFSITPNLWSWRINGDITRLRQNQILKPDTPLRYITSLFIDAGNHLLKLDSEGYQQDFLDLAEAIDFPMVKEYQLPLPTLPTDDDGDGGPKQAGPPKITKADSIPSAGGNEIQDLPNPDSTDKKDLYAGLRRSHARVPDSR